MVRVTLVKSGLRREGRLGVLSEHGSKRRGESERGINQERNVRASPGEPDRPQPPSGWGMSGIRSICCHTDERITATWCYCSAGTCLAWCYPRERSLLLGVWLSAR